MDPITHTLTGVTASNAFFKNRFGKGTTLILAVAANLPDIDALVHLTGDPSVVIWRRTFGHSVFLIPIWAAIASGIFKRFYPGLTFRTIYSLTLFGCAMHLFFDLINSFGVVPFWPVSHWRPEFGTVFIIDLALTGILAAPLILSLLPPLNPRLRLLSRISAVCAALYVAFCFINRNKAEKILEAEAAHSAPQASLKYVFPEPFGPHRWHGVILNGGAYREYQVYSLKGEALFRREVPTQQGTKEVDAARETQLGRKLEWMFKAPVWTLQRQGDISIATVYDLRFNSPMLDRRGPFDFHFEIDSKGKALWLNKRRAYPYSGLLKGLNR